MHYRIVALGMSHDEGMRENGDAPLYLFLGEGFAWTDRHHAAKEFASFDEARNFWTQSYDRIPRACIKEETLCIADSRGETRSLKQQMG